MSGIMVVFGTRPEAIKLLPVIDALKARGAPVQVCVTAQHRELLDRVLGPGTVFPDIDLDLMRPGQSVAALTGAIIAALGRVYESARPHHVVVQGDTATALAAAQAAYFARISVAHVEAGLRTGDLAGPHPEEGNRRMIATIAAAHFAPTQTAADALIREGVDPASIHVTGNTVVDALEAARASLRAHPELAADVNSVLRQAQGRKLVLVTCHRRENLARMGEVAEAVAQLAARPDVMVAVILHPNNAARAPFLARLRPAPGLMLLGPLDFLPFTALLGRAYLALTDSGGVQEEAPVLGTPVLVLRNRTERPESVIAGSSILVGTDVGRIVATATRVLDDELLHARMARRHSPYGDGRAAERIAGILCDSTTQPSRSRAKDRTSAPMSARSSASAKLA